MAPVNTAIPPKKCECSQKIPSGKKKLCGYPLSVQTTCWFKPLGGSPFFFTSSLDPKESKTPTHKITAPRRKAALHASVAASPRVKQDVWDDIWYVVYDIWTMMNYDIWYMIYTAWCMTYDVWCVNDITREKRSWDIMRYREISWDIVRYHEISWDIVRYSDILRYDITWYDLILTCCHFKHPFSPFSGCFKGRLCTHPTHPTPPFPILRARLKGWWWRCVHCPGMGCG